MKKKTSSVSALIAKTDKMCISDEELFQYPPPKEECSICLLPILFMPNHGPTYQPCCGKSLCFGCMMAADLEVQKGNSNFRCCPFCRTSMVMTSATDFIDRCEKRMALDDPHAYQMVGGAYFQGTYGLSRDKKKAFELFSKAANLGLAESHGHLANAYQKGLGVKKSKKMAEYHCKLAAIGGHDGCRNMLGNIEKKAGNMDRAMKHYMIAASAGNDNSLKKVGEGYKGGYVTKEEYAKTLRAFKVSQDEVKSEERRRAVSEALEKSMEYTQRELNNGNSVCALGNLFM